MIHRLILLIGRRMNRAPIVWRERGKGAYGFTIRHYAFRAGKGYVGFCSQAECYIGRRCFPISRKHYASPKWIEEAVEGALCESS